MICEGWGIRHPASIAVVSQLRLARDYSVEARDSAQIRVNRQEVVVRHALIVGPRHDLEKIAIDPGESRNAVCGYGGSTVRMQVIEIRAMPYDLTKLRKRMAAFRPTGFVGCQVTADNVWTRRRTYWTEVLPPTQVDIQEALRMWAGEIAAANAKGPRAEVPAGPLVLDGSLS
jgi:hypothetical protein